MNIPGCKDNAFSRESETRPQVLVIVKGFGKSSLENINGFLDFRLCHNVNRGLRVMAICARTLMSRPNIIPMGNRGLTILLS